MIKESIKSIPLPVLVQTAAAMTTMMNMKENNVVDKVKISFVYQTFFFEEKIDEKTQYKHLKK